MAMRRELWPQGVMRCDVPSWMPGELLPSRAAALQAVAKEEEEEAERQQRGPVLLRSGPGSLLLRCRRVRERPQPASLPSTRTLTDKT